MIEIVKEGKPLNEITCGKCECVFRFGEKDVSFHRDWLPQFLGWNYFYVTCPHCKNELRHVVSVIDKPQYERLCKKFGKTP